MFDYTGRDEASLLVLADTYAQELLPEWKARDDNDLNWATIKIIAKLLEVPNFYNDLAFNEQFPSTVQVYRNALLLAKKINMPVKKASGAFTTLTVTLKAGTTASAPFTVSRGSKFSYGAGNYLATEDVTFNIGEVTKNVLVRYGTVVNGSLGLSDGTALQRFEIPVDNAQDESLKILIDGSEWEEEIDTLMMRESTDEVYKKWLEPNERYSIDFGDDKFGKIPNSGLEITYSVFTIGDSKGNLPAFNIIKSELADVETVLQSVAATGGSDKENIADIKSSLPKWVSIQNRVVMEKDCIFLAKRYQEYMM